MDLGGSSEGASHALGGDGPTGVNPSAVSGGDLGSGALVAAGEAAVLEDASSDNYNINTVNDLIEKESWPDLENYFVHYLPVSPGEDVAMVHARLMLLFRIGHLIKLTDSGESEIEIDGYFQNQILPLRASETKYADRSKLQSQIDNIAQLRANKMPITNLYDVEMLKDVCNDYVRVYFPDVIGFKHASKTASAFSRFVIKVVTEQTSGTPTTVRCLLCQETIDLKKKAIKTLVKDHMHTCSGITPCARDMFTSALGQEKTREKSTSESGGRGKRGHSDEGCRSVTGQGGRKKARGLDPFADMYCDRSESVNLMVAIGKVCYSQERNPEKFDTLVKSMTDLLFDLGKSASRAGHGPMGTALQSPVASKTVFLNRLGDIKTVSSIAVKRLCDLNIAYYSEDNISSTFDGFANEVFKISNNATLAQISRSTSSTGTGPASGQFLQREQQQQQELQAQQLQQQQQQLQQAQQQQAQQQQLQQAQLQQAQRQLQVSSGLESFSLHLPSSELVSGLQPVGITTATADGSPDWLVDYQRMDIPAVRVSQTQFAEVGSSTQFQQFHNDVPSAGNDVPSVDMSDPDSYQSRLAELRRTFED